MKVKRRCTTRKWTDCGVHGSSLVPSIPSSGEEIHELRIVNNILCVCKGRIIVSIACVKFHVQEAYNVDVLMSSGLEQNV